MTPRTYNTAGRVTPSLDPALEVACPYCEAPAGNPCVGSHVVHPARRSASYRARYPGTADVPPQRQR